MKRIAWVTDPHFNFASPNAISAFFLDLAVAAPDYVLIGGDIAEAPSLEEVLQRLDQDLHCPIYFVLGNHDYYHGSIDDVRARVRTVVKAAQHLNWLPDARVVPLADDVGLVGCGGWGDGRLGNFMRSSVRVNDYDLIADLARLGRAALLAKLVALGKQAARHLRAVLPEALDRFRHVIVLMHVPPFAEACWYQGRTGDTNWLPHFTSGLAGDALRNAMRANPHRHMTVLCGHTHHAGEADILPNLHVVTGAAEYGRPRVTRILDV